MLCEKFLLFEGVIVEQLLYNWTLSTVAKIDYFYGYATFLQQMHLHNGSNKLMVPRNAWMKTIC